MSKLVTIGIPVYKRLEYLPNALRIVASQDYPNVEILISDNGMNGTAVPAIVDKHYSKPYRFRQNPSTVSVSTHFNQLIHNASGEYFVLLPDDDEISPNYVSELVSLLERRPEASAALAAQETIDEAGNLIRRTKDTVPEIMSGRDFVRTTWGTHEYGYQSLCTFLAKTQTLIACGGFPDIWAGTSDEDVLLVKLSLDRPIAFSTHCAFRKRYYETSMGYAIELQDLARGIRELTGCLDSDPGILKYAASHPAEWNESRRYLVDSGWNTYYYRWTGLYRKRLSFLQWVKAGFALPSNYYKTVVSILIAAVLSPAAAPVKRFFPQAYGVLRHFKTAFKS